MFCKRSDFCFLMTLQAVAIPNATKTPQSVAGASHDFNDVHFLTAWQFARRPHAATCLPGPDSFIASTAAGIAFRSQRPLTGARLALAGTLRLCTVHLGRHNNPFLMPADYPPSENSPVDVIRRIETIHANISASIGALQARPRATQAANIGFRRTT